MTTPRTPEQQKKIDRLMQIAFLLVVLALVFIGAFALAASSIIDRTFMGFAASGAAVLMLTAIVLMIVVIRSARKSAPPATPSE